MKRGETKGLLCKHESFGACRWVLDSSMSFPLGYGLTEPGVLWLLCDVELVWLPLLVMSARVLRGSPARQLIWPGRPPLFCHQKVPFGCANKVVAVVVVVAVRIMRLHFLLSVLRTTRFHYSSMFDPCSSALYGDLGLAPNLQILSCLFCLKPPSTHQPVCSFACSVSRLYVSMFWVLTEQEQAAWEQIYFF
jgi:hypothetical protein